MNFLKAIGIFLGGALGAVIVVLGAIVMLLIAPVLAVVMGWLTGYFIELIFGGYISSGINALFSTSLVDGDLPKISAAIGFISYLLGSRSKLANIKKKKGDNENG